MRREFEFINFFRAMAAFWVLIAHCMVRGGWHGTIPNPKIAVDLFMIISGFLMAANAVYRKDTEPLTNLRNWLRFWLRRYFRIAPAYYVSLALAIILSGYFLSGYQELQSLDPEKWTAGGAYDPARIKYTLTNIMLHISFLFGLHPEYSFSTFLPDWSLSLEMQFYFIFPALIIVMQKFGFLKMAIIIGLPVFMLGLGISEFIKYNEPSLIFMKLNYFIVGILLFKSLSINNDKIKSIALALCAIFFVSLDISYGKQLILLPFLLSSMFILGWMEIAQKTPRYISYLTNNSVIRFASDASYSVYLFHGFFISAFGLILSNYSGISTLSTNWRIFIMVLFVTILTYLCAYISYKFIELPGISLGKYFTKKVPAKKLT